MLINNKYILPLLGSIFSLNTLIVGSQAQASTLNPGDISFLEQCPGDELAIKDDVQVRILPLIPALLTPLITGAVDFALKSTGERLTQAAQPFQADLLHRGSYFYVVKEGPSEIPNSEELNGEEKNIQYWDQKPWCLIVVSRATKATDTKVSDLVEDYARYKFEIDTTTRKRTYVNQISDKKAQSTLIDELKKLGFQDQTTPGLLAIFDFDVSDQGTTFRLIPRFVVMDHSIREKKVDDRGRDISFEFNFGIPGKTPQELKPMIKIEGLKIRQPFQGNPERPSLTSHWIARPQNDADKPSKAKVDDNILIAGQRGRTFDLTIEIKEFRKRPIARFFGGLLTNDTTRSQFVQPIVSTIDPATRQAAQALEEANQTALKVALSDLIDKAEQARREYEQATEGPDKEFKKDKLLSAQRTANLKAQEAGIKIPYPEAGFFRISP